MISQFTGILDRDVLLELAGARYFERGEGYYHDGRVRALVEHEGVLAARVVGTGEYRVRFRAEDGELVYSCDCPLGVDGEFCKHCVAVGLAWLGGDSSEKAAGTMDDLRSYLEGRDREELVRIVLDQALEDELLRERLLLRASRESPEGPDLDAFRRIIEDAFDPGDFPESYSEYARGIENVVGSLRELLKEGFAAETIELAEHALRAAEGAMDYDAEGYIHGVLHDLGEIHYAACEEAQPDPEALARRLFEWELRGHYDAFLDAVHTYADVLGEEGLAVYRKLAEEEWARTPELRPGQDDPHRYGRRFRITHIMETLARQEGDVEALVSVMSRDLSRQYDYLRIAEVYRQAGDHDKALDWAERGARAFPEGTDSRLREFLADEYHRKGRHEEAVELIWAEFAEAPRFESYRRLKSHADRDGAWSLWREKALDYLRDYVARRKEESNRGYLLFSMDHSTLVEIFLWEGRDEDAWREANQGGCSEKLWLQLAREREQEHPEDALSVYLPRIEPLINRTNNAAYGEAYELLLKVRELMRRLDREQEFAGYLEEIRLEYKRKRNFMKLLEGME